MKTYGEVQEQLHVC